MQKLATTPEPVDTRGRGPSDAHASHGGLPSIRMPDRARNTGGGRWEQHAAAHCADACLSAICATCGLLAWTSPTPQVGMTMVLGGIAMVVVHLALMHDLPDATMHMAGGTCTGGPTSDTFVDVLTHVGVTLAGLQALVAVLARTGGEPLSAELRKLARWSTPSMAWVSIRVCWCA